MEIWKNLIKKNKKSIDLKMFKNMKKFNYEK